jgi:hypothetical protein
MNIKQILYTFTAAGTGAKFLKFVVFVCSGGGAAVQLSDLPRGMQQYIDAVSVSLLFTHNSVQEKVKLSWLQKADR